jgi:hypothetical protein
VNTQISRRDTIFGATILAATSVLAGEALPLVEPAELQPLPLPDATNTGVPPETVLTDYAGPNPITVAGTVIDSKRFTKGQLYINAPNVVIRKCLFQFDDWWLINGDKMGGNANMLVENCTFNGGVKGILGQGTFQRLNISNCIIGLTLKEGKSTIRDCYIHDLDAHAEPKDPHFDCIFISGGQTDCLVEHNHCHAPTEGGTCNVFIATRWRGSNIVNTTVNNNLLLGTPSYSMYNEQTDVATITGTKWTNNKIQKAANGYWTWKNSEPYRSGNTDYNTGANIDNK